MNRNRMKHIIILTITMLLFIASQNFIYSNYTKKYSNVAFDFSVADWYFGKDISKVSGHFIVYHKAEFNDKGRLVKVEKYESSILKSKTDVELDSKGKIIKYTIYDKKKNKTKIVNFDYQSGKLFKINEKYKFVANKKMFKNIHYYNSMGYRVKVKEFDDKNDLRKFINFYNNGKKQLIGFLEKGKKVSTWKYYNNIARLIREEYYEEGRLLSTVKFEFDKAKRVIKTLYYKNKGKKLILNKTIRIIRNPKGKIVRYEKYDAQGKLLKKYDKNKKPIE